jgi:hypothetical protein
MKVTHKGQSYEATDRRTARVGVHCGQSQPNRSQFTGNPNLAPLLWDTDWGKVTCKECLRLYVNSDGSRGRKNTTFAPA